MVWVFERTGRSTALAAMSPEEEQLEDAEERDAAAERHLRAGEPAHPHARRASIAALEKLVDEQQAARAVPDANGEPAAPASSLDLELAPIDARLEFIAQDKALIEQTLTELEASIQATPANEMALNGLDRELANLNDQYNAAVASLGQAKVGERIEVLSKGERFSLIEQPTVPGSPVRPKRLLIASAGIVGGLGAGLGFVVLLEMLNRSIRRPLDLSEKLGLEPFATVPYIRTAGEVRRKRSLVVLALVLVAVAIPAALLAVHTLYLPLDLVFSELLAKIGLGADVPS